MPIPKHPFLLLFLAATPAFAAPLDFSAVARLPVQKRPNTDETMRMPQGHPLVQAMYTDSVNFYKLRYLLPGKFRIADGKNFQGALDELLLKIGDTEAGRQLICPFAVDSEKDVQNYFHASAAAAARLRSGCRNIKISDAVKMRLRVMRGVSLPFQPEPLVPFKRIVFIFTESARPGVEAYTTTRNVTYFVLSKETMNAEHLLRALAHELAISYDQLSRVAYLQDPTAWDRDIGLAFNRAPADDPYFEPYSSADVQKLKCAYRDPALKYAATAQRAFRFEDDVVSQRKEEAASPAVSATGTCGSIYAKNSVLLQAMARAVSWETGWYEAACGKLARDPAARLKQLLTRIKTIESLQLKISGKNERMSFCDLTLNYRLGPNHLDIYSGGPRPRMGGWEASAIMDKASRGEPLSKEELLQLNESLSFPDMDRLYREEDELEGRRR